ncbi:hypothetical protein MED121_02155 [Marinomonas sp. MED121]|nr:hypothetical protein MED121_02155 [Marinomonas sp. MED121]
MSAAYTQGHGAAKPQWQKLQLRFPQQVLPTITAG